MARPHKAGLADERPGLVAWLRRWAGAALGRRTRSAPIAGAASGDAGGPLDGMSRREFEALVGEAFGLQGYQIAESGQGAHGGIDLVLRKERQTYLVRSREWKANKVGVDVVRELLGTMSARGAAGGFALTSGRFTREAMALAGGRNLRLIEGPALTGLIRQARAARRTKITTQAA